MKEKLFICLLIVIALHCQAQVAKVHIDQFKKIVKLVKENRVQELASLVIFPLKRENPLPDISSEKEFILYYPLLFDSGLKLKLAQMKSSDIFMHNGDYGIFAGDMWIDEDGKIITINYSSPQEMKLKEKLTIDSKNKMHPSLRSWKRNILVYKCKRYTIRIDDTDKGLRLASWNKGRKLTDKPDLLLYNGVQEFYGTQGGIGYTFKNGGWTYLIEDRYLCDDKKDCGTFLKIYHAGKEAGSWPCRETK